MQAPKCPQCSRDIPVDAPGGTCPDCLLGMGLGDEIPTRVTTPKRSTPSVEEMNRHFPHLDILSMVGQGGMGIVYKARQSRLDRIVALKVIPPEWSAGDEFNKRFTREARTMAKLDHPHIVRVHEFGETDGLHFLVMEFVDGSNLRQVMDANRLTPAEALAIVPQVCDALQYAHDRGVVHRDIKPENVLIDRDGKVKIADFGLAKLVQRGEGDFTLTGAGQVMGTLHYMAPEQYKTPNDVDHRADLFSLGVVFYEMLTGELPVGRFDSPSHTKNVDVRLDNVVLRALERERDRRYQQASELRTDVDAITSFAWDRDVVDEFHVVDDEPPPRRDHERTLSSDTRRTSRLAVIGALGTPLAILFGFLTYWFISTFTVHGAGDFIGAQAGILVTISTLGAGCVLSIVAWIVVASSPRLTGQGWAIFGTLFPVFAIIPIMFFTLFAASVDSPHDSGWLEDGPEDRPRGWSVSPSPAPPRSDPPVREAAPSRASSHDEIRMLWVSFQVAKPLGEAFQAWLRPEDQVELLRLKFQYEKRRKDRRLGLLLSDLSGLSTPIHEYEIKGIKLLDGNRVAAVTVSDGTSTVTFPMVHDEGRWWFTLGHVDVK